ncbi:MAG TPA: DNA-processing protein DprA [Patescibacteria group bacterium]|nr:DNA-processing protein DprA [Patescibacteria group bacterium]
MSKETIKQKISPIKAQEKALFSFPYIHELSLQDPDFPKLLQEIPNPPVKLYYRGNISILNDKNLLSVVGSRKMTAYGKAACRSLLTIPCQQGIRLVSGMALGIDGEVHSIAIENKQPTVAVLANGLDDQSLHPKTHFALSRKILEYGGCLISEYSPGTPALKHNFYERNRIISGLSRATLLVEAQTRSGTMITARYALEQNRDVLAVPGRITDSYSSGTNQLISQGATPITNHIQLMEYFNLAAKPPMQLSLDLSGNERTILDILTIRPLTADGIAETSALPAHITLSTLTSLELKGFLEQSKGYYIICRN